MGIKVVVVRPGDFSTGFTSSRKKVGDEVALQAYPLYHNAIEKVEHDENGGLKPVVLARKIIKIIQKKRPHDGYVVASFEQKLSVLLKRILPAKWFDKILGSYYKL